MPPTAITTTTIASDRHHYHHFPISYPGAQAPEINSQDDENYRYGAPVDVFALGVTFGELLFWDFFEAQEDEGVDVTELLTPETLLSLAGAADEAGHFPPVVLDLLAGMIEVDPVCWSFCLSPSFPFVMDPG